MDWAVSSKYRFQAASALRRLQEAVGVHIARSRNRRVEVIEGRGALHEVGEDRRQQLVDSGPHAPVDGHSPLHQVLPHLVPRRLCQ